MRVPSPPLFITAIDRGVCALIQVDHLLELDKRARAWALCCHSQSVHRERGSERGRCRESLMEEKGVVMLRKEGCFGCGGIMEAGLASSLAGNRILNGCLLALMQTHTPSPALPAPHLTRHTLVQSTSSGLLLCVCVCVPPEATQRITLLIGLIHSNHGHFIIVKNRSQTESR